jgi:DNA-binding transcriptional ArsR family regulator
MTQRLDMVFSALADPTRRAMLARLASGDATVGELVERFDLTQPAISKHLKVLERAGLVSRTRAAQTRPCHLEPAPLKAVDGWIGRYRSLWEESFEQLDAFLKATAPKAVPSRRQTAPAAGRTAPNTGTQNGKKR